MSDELRDTRAAVTAGTDQMLATVLADEEVLAVWRAALEAAADLGKEWARGLGLTTTLSVAGGALISSVAEGAE